MKYKHIYFTLLYFTFTLLYFTLLYFTLRYLTFSLSFVNRPTDQTIEPIFTRSGSNNTVWPKEVLFLVSHQMKLLLKMSVSYRSGLVKGTFVLAWFGVGLQCFLGSAIVSIF
jgi:hypothetical protein